MTKTKATSPAPNPSTVPGTAKGGKPTDRPGVAVAPKRLTTADVVNKVKPPQSKAQGAVERLNKSAPSRRKTDSVPAHVANKATTRMPKTERQGQILTAAVKVAGASGYIAMTRAAVAAQAKVSECLITRYFATMDTLRDAVVQRTIEESRQPGILINPAMYRILAEALVAKHPAGAREAKKHKDAIVALLFK